MPTPAIHIENYGLAFSDEDPVGEDPRYLDEFDVAHSEINKLAGNDFNLIEQQCRYILLEKSKDLRIAGYLLLSLTFSKEINGLIEGLSIYNELLSSFGATLHPARPAAKAAAIKWLNNPKIEVFIQHAKMPDIKTFTLLKQLVSQLNEQLTAYFPEIQSQFFILNAWLNKQTVNELAPQSIASQVMSKVMPQKHQEKKAQPQVIETHQEYIAHSKVLFNYFKKNQQRSDAIALTRAVHWSKNFTLPKHHQNKTKVMSIRKEGLVEINRLFEQNSNPETLFHCCETAFWDNGGPYLLDLNFYAFCALEQLEDYDAIDQLTLTVRQLIKRLPELPYLYFEDDMPFANNDTRQWLTNITSMNTTTTQPASLTINNDKSPIDFMKQVQLQTGSKNVFDQIQALKLLPVLSERQDIEKSFAIAQLLAKKNHDIALTYYQGIIKKIRKYHLDMWLPELAVPILTAYLRLMKNTHNQGEEISHIISWLSQLDPCACI